MRSLPVLLAGVALVLVPLGGAAASDLDPAFGRGGKVVTPFGDGAFAWDVDVQRDGRIVVVGSSYEGIPAFLVARYNANGSLDRRFGSGGKVRTELGWADAVAIQRDGKIVVAGYARVEGEESFRANFALVRYKPDGTLDPGFDGDGKLITDFGVHGVANGVAIQPDGKIVAVGSAGGEFAAARYLPTGALDPTFDADGRVVTPLTSTRDAAQDVALQADGKLVVGGWAGWRSLSFESPPDFAVARYNRNGSLDTAFDGDGTVITALDRRLRSFGNDVALQRDGKILLAGGPVVRYNADGSVDSSFGNRGTLVIPVVYAWGVAVQRDRKILAVGEGEGDFTVDRFHPDGRWDAAFAPYGHVATDFGAKSGDSAFGVAVQRDGKFVVAGNTSASSQASSGFALARYLGDAACVVPGVRGATLSVARSRIVRAGCTVGRVTRKSSPRIENGRVISQTPRAGTRLRVGGKVDLVVSRGRP